MVRKKIKLLNYISVFFLILILMLSIIFLKKYQLNYYKGTTSIRINTCDIQTLSKLKYIDAEKAQKIIESRPIKHKIDLVKKGFLTEEQLNEIRFDFVTLRQENILKKQLGGTEYDD